jgi:Zinc knuckle
VNDGALCFTCGGPGHYARQCPTTAPGTSSPLLTATTTAAPKRYAEIECPTCRRDWVAVLTGARDTLADLTCPWCKLFEVRGGQVYHRITPARGGQ